LTDPWQTGLVDLPGIRSLGQVTGCTSAAVAAWLNERGQAWRDPVEVVAIDPAAPYRTYLIALG
jgi:transposase